MLQLIGLIWSIAASLHAGMKPVCVLLSPFMILPYTAEVSGLILWLFCRRHNSDEVAKKFVVQLSVLAVLIGTSNDHGELL